MAYDEMLAERIRALTRSLPGARERPMFGGLAVLLDGNMAVAASGQGGLLVRCDPEASDELARAPGVTPMVMRGRAMRGWLRVDADSVLGDAELERWVGIGLEYARRLPPKR
jgi:TfoX/Sxy family transcriptional regulator of competence genes